MKELSEYKQMILQRSEERQQQRKRNRVRLIACCIPLAICITAAAAWSQLPRSVSKDAVPECNLLTGMAVSGDSSVIADKERVYTLEISQGSSAPITFSNQDQIRQLISIIEDCYITEEYMPEKESEMSFGSTLPTEHIVGSTQPNYAMGDFGDLIKEKYTIRLNDCYGNETVYCLTDDQLTNSLTGQTVTLETYQLIVLQEALDALI